jgi:hypothetical protein
MSAAATISSIKARLLRGFLLPESMAAIRSRVLAFDTLTPWELQSASALDSNSWAAIHRSLALSMRAGFLPRFALQTHDLCGALPVAMRFHRLSAW